MGGEVIAASADGARREVSELVLQFIAGVVVYNHRVTQSLGLGASDSQFLTLLTVHGPLAPRELAELTGLTSGSVTGVLDRLEDAGYIHRERATDDKRRVIVTPVPQAQARVAAKYAGYGEHMAAVLSQRNVDQLETIRMFLYEMIHTDSEDQPAP